jgi:tetratricopeptide (TPR) repeat protein
MAANYYYGFWHSGSTGMPWKHSGGGERRVRDCTLLYCQIYLAGKKEEAITYIQNKLQSGSNTQYYDLELKQMLGHAYFEKKEYAKALPYLAEFVSRSKKVRREDLYELSYSYYQANQLSKAIDGFKQLSGKDDSLSQHSMYLLGDAYLKTGQKSMLAFLFCSSNSNLQQRDFQVSICQTPTNSFTRMKP